MLVVFSRESYASSVALKCSDDLRQLALQLLLAAIVGIPTCAPRIRTKNRLAEVLRQRVCRVCRAIDLERSDDLQ